MAMCLRLLSPTLLLAAASALAQPTQTVEVAGRLFTLPSDTPVIIDDEPGVLADLIGRPAGMQLTWLAAGNGMHGNLPPLVFSYSVIGPVTTQDPLRVLGQEIAITGDTVLEGFSDPSELVPGTPLVVAGLVDANGSLLASLVERRGAQGNTFLLGGVVQETLSAPVRARVGEQWMLIDIAFTDCAGGVPALGDYIQIRADSIENFQAGDVIDTLSSGQCANPVPFGTAGAQGSLEGLVSAVGPGDSLTFGDLVISWNAATVFEFGGPDDVEPGAAIGVEGVFQDAGHLLADSIEFVRPVVRFEAPMQPADVTPGEAIRPFGVGVFNSPQLRDEDGIMANGLTAPTQVEVRGWIDRLGDRFAFRVRERGDADANDVSLRAPVAAINAPTLDMLGLTINTSGALFFDADELPMTPGEFFSQVQLNHVVDISGATWSAPTNTLHGGSVILLGYEHTEPLPGTAGTQVAGIVRNYGLGDAIFFDGFEAAP
jgi:hypothetical protein